jgi:hypothetical protein
MRSAASIFLPVCVFVLAASMNQPRAEDTYAPAEGAPMRQAPGAARPGIVTLGEVHTTAFNKPCLESNASSQGLLSDKAMFSYVVAVSNKCGKSIKLQICQKDRSGCNSATVPPYAGKDMVMGFGPCTDFFNYIVKESP